MSRKLNASLIIGGALVGATALAVLGGPLNPPEGPVQPTMRTLDEIYAVVEQLALRDPCQTCTWQYEKLFSQGPTVYEVFSDPVHLHGVWVGPGGSGNIGLFEMTPEGSLIEIIALRNARANGEAVDNFVQLDIRVERLHAVVATNLYATLLYRSAP